MIDLQRKSGKVQVLTTEDVINIIADKPSPVVVIIWIALMSFMASASFGSYYPSFGGYIPYTEWRCFNNSILCLDRIKDVSDLGTISTEKGKELLCGTGGQEELKPGRDVYWDTSGRTSFSIDWNLQCGGEFLLTLTGSLGYVGNLMGSAGGNLYDIFGRKRGALLGCAILLVTNVTMIAAASIEVFLFLRLVWGIGLMLAMDGIFVILMEYTATKNRPVVNSGFQFFWAVGYILSPTLGYYITSWKWLMVPNVCLYILPTVAVLLLPESPGYYLVNKSDEEEAKKSLKWLGRLNNHELDIDKVSLKEDGSDTEEKKFLEALKDFITYREMTVQVLLQMFMWFVVGFLYYGFTFSWGLFGSSLYLSYLYPALAESVAYVAMTFPLTYIGRKISNIAFFSVACVSFLSALIPYSAGSITIEQLSCLVGTMFVSAAFGGVYIFSAELAPTSHRGKIMGYVHCGSQIGAIIGPQARHLFQWNRSATLIMFAILAGLAGLFCFRLPETKGVPTPNTAEEVQERRDRLNKNNGRTAKIFKNAIASDSVI